MNGQPKPGFYFVVLLVILSQKIPGGIAGSPHQFANTFLVLGVLFLLSSKHTDCLAKELCGIPTPTSENQPNACNPSSGCC